MASRAKQMRKHLRVPSRDSSGARRAALVPATVVRIEGDEQALARLIGHMIVNAGRKRGDKFPRGLADYRMVLGKTGREHIVELARGLLNDGGRFLRTIARATPEHREAAHGAAVLLCRMMSEHGITAASAGATILRSCLASGVADACMAKVLAGTATDVDARLATNMSTSARLDLLTALQLQKQADQAAKDAEHQRRRTITSGGTDAGAPAVVRPEIAGLKPSQLVRCDKCDFTMPGTALVCGRCGAEIAPDPNAPAIDVSASDSPTNGKKASTST